MPPLNDKKGWERRFDDKVKDGTLVVVEYGCDGDSEGCCGGCGYEYISESAVKAFIESEIKIARSEQKKDDADTLDLAADLLKGDLKMLSTIDVLRMSANKIRE